MTLHHYLDKAFTLLISILVFTSSNFLITSTATSQEQENNLTDKSKLIRVLSYNIHYGIGMDGKKNLQRIAEVIKGTNADIIGLQEVSNSAMVAELGQLTNMNGVFGPSTEIEPPNLYNLLNIPVPESQLFYGDAILSKHPFEYLGNISIPSASSSRYQAMCTDVDLSNIYGKGSIIRFVTTHFDYLNTIGSNAARKATVEVIENAFFSDAINKPAILTGDFNVIPGSEPIRLLQKNGWVYENLGENYYTIPTENPTRQIDYVLPRPSNKWRIKAVEVIDAPVASDHLPVLMTLELISED